MLAHSQSASLALDDDVSDMIAVDTTILSVPDSLVDEDIWIGYCADDDRKVPIDPSRPRDPAPIDATDTSYGVDFAEALEAVHTSRQTPGRDITGVGLQLDGDDELCLVDIDDCVDEGRIEEWALDMATEIGSYAEISPSQSGIHILVRDPEGVDGEYARKDEIEVYDSSRYATFSGAQLRDVGSEIERVAGIVRTYQHLHNDERQTDSSESTTRISADEASEDGLSTHQFADAVCADEANLDDDIRGVVEAMCQYDDDGRGLWEHGHTASCASDDKSTNDMALMRKLAWWTIESQMFEGVDFEQADIERAFLSSALGERSKVRQRPDYVSLTAGKAIRLARN